MILTIWRHGEAKQGSVDRQRELTAAGCDDIGFGCHQFHEICKVKKIPGPDRIVYSPWLRTYQTAEILAAAFTHAALAEEAALRPDSDVAAVDAALAAIVGREATTEHIVLVSHQPLVTQLSQHYLGVDAAAAVPSLSPGGLLSMSIEVVAPACGTLLFWAFPPEYEAGV